MTTITPPSFITDLNTVELRVQTQMLQQLVNGDNTNVQELRNEEATALGYPVPVPTA